jgi:hypothetical protein
MHFPTSTPRDSAVLTHSLGQKGADFNDKFGYTLLHSVCRLGKESDTFWVNAAESIIEGKVEEIFEETI